MTTSTYILSILSVKQILEAQPLHPLTLELLKLVPVGSNYMVEHKYANIGRWWWPHYKFQGEVYRRYEIFHRSTMTLKHHISVIDLTNADQICVTQRTYDKLKQLNDESTEEIEIAEKPKIA